MTSTLGKRVTAAGAPQRRRWLFACGAVLAILIIGVALLNRREIRTRQVRYREQLCTEYFDTKDGIEVRAECPSRGDEWYVDTLQPRHYAPPFPVTYAAKPSNAR